MNDRARPNSMHNRYPCTHGERSAAATKVESQRGWVAVPLQRDRYAESDTLPRAGT